MSMAPSCAMAPMGQEWAQTWQGLPHSAAAQPVQEVEAPQQRQHAAERTQVTAEEKRSTNRPTASNAAAQRTNGQARANFMVIAV